MFCLFLDCFNKRVNPVLVIPSWLEVESPWLLLRFSFYLQFFFLFQQFDYDVPWYSFLFICVFAWILFDSQIHILRSILHLMWKNVCHRLFKYIFLNSHFHLSVQDSNYTYVRLLDIVLQPTMTVYCFFSVFSFSASSRVAYIAISSSFLLFFFFPVVSHLILIPGSVFLILNIIYLSSRMNLFLNLPFLSLCLNFL